MYMLVALVMCVQALPTSETFDPEVYLGAFHQVAFHCSQTTHWFDVR